MTAIGILSENEAVGLTARIYGFQNDTLVLRAS